MSDSNITFTVCDPGRQYHTVKYEGDKWYGTENLVAHVGNVDVKWWMLRGLKQRMLVEVDGKWQGYEWTPID